VEYANLILEMLVRDSAAYLHLWGFRRVALYFLVLKFADLTTRTAGHVESKLRKEGSRPLSPAPLYIRSEFYYVGLGLKVNSFYNNVCSSGGGIM
jgi:hypothetical protein